MTQEEMKTIFEEIVKSGVVLHVQYNRGNGKNNYEPGPRYDVQYDEQRKDCHVVSQSGQNCGSYDMSYVITWFFRDCWKIDGVFVDEWLERYLIPETISDDVEELL